MRITWSRPVPGGYPLMFYTHNLHFMQWAWAQGRYEEAKAPQIVLPLRRPRVKEMQMEECFAAMPWY